MKSAANLLRSFRRKVTRSGWAFGGEERWAQRDCFDCGGSRTGRFKGIYDFCERVDLRQLNKRVLESLIKSGAMDSLGRRSQLMDALDKAMEPGTESGAGSRRGQHGLFGVFEDANPVAVRRRGWGILRTGKESVRLANEKEILGFWISGHPLEYHGQDEDLHALKTTKCWR